jgi:3-hydroxyisobutyrate dehydrogenase
MGYPMAHHLFDAGLLKSVFNRSREKAERFNREHPGTFIAESPAELAHSVDALFICVSADPDVRAMVDAMIPALRPGHLVVDCSTVSRETALEVAHRLQPIGARFADAPVTGGVEGAKNGNLSMMIGASPDLFETLQPLLQAISSRQIHMGAIGSGQAAKAVNQVMCAGINEAVTEALAFGATLGLDMDRLIDAIRGGAAGNWFLDKRGPTMTKGQFDPGFKLALHQKDLRICLEMARRMETELPLTQTTSEDYEVLIAQGHGDEDISSLYRLKRPQS